MRILLALIAINAASLCWAQTVELSDAQALEIGRRIWKNESGATVNGLTAWNTGEEFASLGIAHFIWYPEGKQGPFEESFPKLATYLAKQGVRVPSMDARSMSLEDPGNIHGRFSKVRRMLELRGLLKTTIARQARFAALRLEQALPKMLAAASSSERERIKAQLLSGGWRASRAVCADGLCEFQRRRG